MLCVEYLYFRLRFEFAAAGHAAHEVNDASGFLMHHQHNQPQ
jgi:hypothetical protein